MGAAAGHKHSLKQDIQDRPGDESPPTPPRSRSRSPPSRSLSRGRVTYSVYKGYYRGLVKDFGMDWRAVVCNHVPEVPGTVRSGAWQDSGLVDAGGKGSYRVGGVFLSAERHRAGGGIRRCCLNSSGGEVEALLRRGLRWGDQGWLSRQTDAFGSAAAYRCRLGERCDDAQAPSACATNRNVDVENSGEECGP